MSEKETYIEDVLNATFKERFVRCCWTGAVLSLILGTVDLAAMTARSRSLVALRLLAVFSFAGTGALARTSFSRDIILHRMLAITALTVSSLCVGATIILSGGRVSFALAGQMLLNAAVLGVLPASAAFYAAGAAMLLGGIAVPFFLANIAGANGQLLDAVIAGTSIPGAALLARHWNDRTLRRSLSASFDLERSEEKYRDLFENANDPMFLLDADGRYTDANRRAVELLGYARTELQQMRVLDLIPPEQAARSRAEFEKLRTQGAYEGFEGRMRTKDGRWIDIEVNSSAILTGGKVTGSRDIVRNITERKRFEEDLQRYRKELERHVQERTVSLSALNEALEREVGERRKAELRIGKQLERQRALSTVERSIASSLNLTVTLNVFIEQVMGQLGTDAAAVMLYDRENEELSFAAARGFRSNRIMKVTVRAGRSLAGTVISRQERILIPDLEHADQLYPSPEGYQFKNSFMVKDEGFRSYIGIPLTVKGEVKGILEVFHRRPFRPDEEWLEFLDALSQQASIAIDNASMYAALQMSHAEISLAYDKTIEGWSRALDIRDNETHGHSQRVADLTVRVAQALGIGGGDLVHIRRGALLHDIGKLGVPDSILLKPGRLTDEEMAVMKRHPEIAYEILSPIPFLRDALDIPYLHHEKWDGSGYPRGMRGGDIPTASRIFAVIDVWDALRSDRPYRAAWEEARVVAHLRAERGRHFDPDIVEVFLREVRDGNGSAMNTV